MLIEKHYIENYGLFLRGHTDIITTLSVSCDNKYIVTGSLDCTVRLWDFSEHRQLGILEGHHSPIITVAISTTNKFLVSGSSDKTIRVWSTRKMHQKLLISGHTSSVHRVVITSDNLYIVSGSFDDAIRVWSVQGEQIALIEYDTNLIPAVFVVLYLDCAKV